MSYAVVVLTFVGLLDAVLLWVTGRRLQRLDRVEERLGHLAEAISLLTETAEAGFRTTAGEIARAGRELTAQAVATTSRATTRRVAAAARKGQPASEIARAEQVSEGEVNLRLHLARAAIQNKGRRRNEAEHAAMRA
jgi:hypothetical protein